MTWKSLYFQTDEFQTGNGTALGLKTQYLKVGIPWTRIIFILSCIDICQIERKVLIVFGRGQKSFEVNN